MSLSNKGWTHSQWVEDAVRRVHDPDGPADVVFNHVRSLVLEVDRLRLAVDALTYLVHEEWGDHMSLAEIADTWGTGVITREQVQALRELEG